LDQPGENFGTMLKNLGSTVQHKILMFFFNQKDRNLKCICQLHTKKKHFCLCKFKLKPLKRKQ